MSAPASDTASIPTVDRGRAEAARSDGRGQGHGHGHGRDAVPARTAPPAPPLALRAMAGGVRLASAISPAFGSRFAVPMFQHLGAPVRVAAADAATHAEARRGTVRIPGIRRRGVDVVTYEWGGGPETVVLAHGWQSRASVFAPLVRELRAEGFRIVAFDAPGNGDSPKQRTYIVDHLDALRELQLRHGRFHAVVGHSFGGLAATLAPGEGIDARRVATIASAATPNVFIDGFGSAVGLDAATRRATADRFSRTVFPHEADPFARYSATLRPLPSDLPLLLVHDHADRRVPFTESEALAAANPHARLVPTDGLGHNRILRADVTLDAVVDFVTAPDAALRPAA
ncbi:alpha/beta fold hydrolase [Agromyces sp. NPDC058110]|uniref:alpha/beta fold hydrolase n=1 Tax=Agromyces sp. NPDC058110 TaxID=3346345 RepID=UPI0036DCC0AE